MQHSVLKTVIYTDVVVHTAHLTAGLEDEKRWPTVDVSLKNWRGGGRLLSVTMNTEHSTGWGDVVSNHEAVVDWKVCCVAQNQLMCLLQQNRLISNISRFKLAMSIQNKIKTAWSNYLLAAILVSQVNWI